MHHRQVGSNLGPLFDNMLGRLWQVMKDGQNEIKKCLK